MMNTAAISFYFIYFLFLVEYHCANNHVAWSIWDISLVRIHSARLMQSPPPWSSLRAFFGKEPLLNSYQVILWLEVWGLLCQGLRQQAVDVIWHMEAPQDPLFHLVLPMRKWLPSGWNGHNSKVSTSFLLWTLNCRDFAFIFTSFHFWFILYLRV